MEVIQQRARTRKSSVRDIRFNPAFSDFLGAETLEVFPPPPPPPPPHTHTHHTLAIEFRPPPCASDYIHLSYAQQALGTRARWGSGVAYYVMLLPLLS